MANDELKPGTRVFVKKPADTSKSPIWTSEMDVFDCRVLTVERRVATRSAAEWYVTKESSFVFDRSWLTVIDLRPGMRVRVKKPRSFTEAWLPTMDPFDGMVSIIKCARTEQPGRFELYDCRDYWFDERWLTPVDQPAPVEKPVIVAGCKCGGCSTIRAPVGQGEKYDVRTGAHHIGCTCLSCAAKPKTARQHIAHQQHEQRKAWQRSLVVGCACPACMDRRASGRTPIYGAHHHECNGSCCTRRLNLATPMVVFMCDCPKCNPLRFSRGDVCVVYAAHHPDCACPDCHHVDAPQAGKLVIEQVLRTKATGIGSFKERLRGAFGVVSYVPKHPVYQWRGGDCWDPEGWWY